MTRRALPLGRPASAPPGDISEAMRHEADGPEEVQTPTAKAGEHHLGLGKGLHVEISAPSAVDVLKLLDQVPFTPSQGIRTPSPKNRVAIRSYEHGEMQPSPLSNMSISRTLHFDGPNPESPNYSPSVGLGLDASALGGVAADQHHGQILHQLYFGYSSSPPSSSGQFWPQSMASASSNYSLPQHNAPVSGYQHLSMYQAPPAPPQFGYPSINTGYLHADYNLHSNYNQSTAMNLSTQLGALSVASMHMHMPPLSHPSNQRRGPPNSRFRNGMPMQQRQNRAQTAKPGTRISNESSPNSSSSGSPPANRPGLNQGDSKPRMNARQRRTERRRREREIKAITDHMEALEYSGKTLAGEERRLYDFHLEEVKSLMSQVQHQQQDNGQGALIEYHLRKLRSLLSLPEPVFEGGKGGPDDHSPDKGASPGQHADDDLSDQWNSFYSHEDASESLESSFDNQPHVVGHVETVAYNNPFKGAVPDDNSPEHPSTPENFLAVESQKS